MVKYGGACQLVEKLCGLSGNLGRASRVFCLEAECPTPFHTEVVMRYRHLIALAGGGLVMLVLAVLLFTGRLPYFTAEVPEDDPAPPTNVLTSRSGSNELAAGGLFVFRPGADTPSDWAETLKSCGVTIGSPTGDGAYLIRVPEGASLDADKLPGAHLRAYTAEDRLSGELRAAVSTIKSEAKVGARTGKEDSAGTPSDAAERPPETPSAIGEITVTVSLFDPGDKHTVADLVRELGGSVLRGLDEDDAAALRVTLPAQSLAELAAAPETVYIESYTSPDMLNDRAAAVAGITPLTVPGFATRTGLTGAGQIVAIADSGIDHGSLSGIHPDLASTPGRMPKIVSINPFSGDDPSDPIGHGTHMAATIAGTGAASGGKYRGVAPGAGLLVQSILNNQGRIDPPADLVSLFRPAYEAGPRIHVNGWGGQTNAYRSASAQVDRFVRYYPDFLVIFGAGNDGPHARTLTPEANSKNALVVGAAQNPRPAYGENSWKAGEMASFSSRGPTADGRIKPDLVAPGTAVISARSRLGPQGVTGNPDYIRMQGTSQAAAVAGGAAAILREYFTKEEELSFVPAALLKAALINGCRPMDAGVEGAGFGLLDLTSTVLSLRTKSFLYADHRDGLAEGEEAVYKYEVKAPGTTFRATLAWTDPAAAPGAARTLVNDLDLVVRAPDGSIHLGNDDGGTGTRDRVNNVEQVTIDNAAPGTYTVTVRGASITASAVRNSFARAQDFALVYGELPVRGVVAGYRSGTLELKDGVRLAVPSGVQPYAVVDHQVTRDIVVGSDLYFFPRDAEPRLYLFAQTWQAQGITTLSVGGQTIFTELNGKFRDGGYLFDPLSVSELRMNGEKRSGDTPVPTGADLFAVVNPSTQCLWQGELRFAERWGTLAGIDADAQTLRLIGEDTGYRVGGAVVAVTDRIVDGGWADTPFGATAPADFRQLLPGTNLYLVLSPQNGAVRYLEARRLIALGMVREISANWIALDTGERYQIFPGASVRRDGVDCAISDIRPGDHVSVVLMDDPRQVLSIEARSWVRYGQVVYLDGPGRSLYLLDVNNRFQILRLAEATTVFRWGTLADAAALAPGQWVRLTFDPSSGTVQRIDIAETAEQSTGVVAAYSPDECLLRLEDGREYKVSPRARITRNGFPISPADLRTGETVGFTVLAAPAPTNAVLTALAAETGERAAPPELTVSALPLREYLFISGRTSADKVYLCRADGSRQRVAVTDGAFSIPVERMPGEDVLRVVALNTRDGGVNGVDLSFQRTSAVHTGGFTDISGSWAKVDIETLADRGLLSGYPDGTFRPDHPVSRGEFTAILVRVLGWSAKTPVELPFSDRGQIPAWLAPSVAAAESRGLVSGYPDGSFRPGARVTRVEAASMLVRALTDFTDAQDDTLLPDPPFADWSRVPEWARGSVSRAYEAGFFQGRQYRLFAPDAPITRAELAAIINRYLSSAEN